MGIVFRQSVKTSLVIFSGAILGTLIIWLSTKYIAKQPLGFTRNLTNNALVLSQILIAGLNSTLVVFIHKYAINDNRRKLLITLCLGVPLFFALLTAVPFFFLRSWILHHFQPADIPFMDRYYLLLPVYTVLFILVIMLEQYLGSQMKVAVSAFMREVVVRLITIALILLFAFQYISFDLFVVGSVLVYLAPIFVCFVLSLQTEGFGFSFRFHAFNKAEYKDLIHFSWYHFLLLLTVTLMNYLDTMALPLYDHKGFSAVAVYYVAVFLVSFMQMPSKAMLMPTITVLSQAIANDDTEKARNIFERSSINVLIATLFMAIVIGCNLGNAITVIEKGYEEILPLFLILFVGRFVDLATGLNDAILSITKHYRFSFYVSGLMIALLFVLIRILVPLYGVFGAAWSTSITLVVFNICKYIFVWKKLGMQPFSIRSLLVIAAGLPALAAGYFLPHFFSGLHHIYIYSIVDVCVRSLVIVFVYVGMLLWLRPSPDLEDYLTQVKANKKLF